MSITKLIAELDSAADTLALIGNYGSEVVNYRDICTQLAKRLHDLEKSLDGCVLVSREPTEAMCDAGGEWMYNEYPSLEFNDSHSIYKAMLSIAEEAE